VSPLASWLRARPAWRGVAAGLALAAVLVVLLAGRGRDGAAPAPRAAAVTAASPLTTWATPAMTTPAPSVSPAPMPEASSVAQATATVRAFLVAYASSAADDSPAALRARLRPYDTDSLDARLSEGAGATTRSAGGSTASVQRITVLGLAPDGRLVVTAQVAVVAAGAAARDQYVELYLAETPAGWRVAEVAL
jgi:hypothetical protein